MRAYVVATGRRIAPFGDPVAEVAVGGVPLAVWQDALFRRFGLEPVRVASVEDIPSGEARLVTHDDVFFTRRILKSFLARWNRAEPRQAALPAGSTFLRLHSDLQDFVVEGGLAHFRFYGLPPGARLEDAAPLELIFKEKVLKLRMPKTITGLDEWVHPVTSSVILHLGHWLHVLQANLLSIQIRWVDEVLAHPLWAAWTVLRGAVPGRGGVHWRVGARANRIGKRVDIHPTARVEGSFIGDDVFIGPQALVRASIIGAGSVLQERVNVTFAVVGDRSFVSKHSVVYACASFEEAELCMKGMQMCLVGRRAALTARASPIDVSPGRKIRVRDGDRYPEVDVPILGSCYGHDVFIGADVYIGPGRAIPNGLRIVPQPARVLSRVPDDLDPKKLYTIVNGTLEEPK